MGKVKVPGPSPGVFELGLLPWDNPYENKL
jgi:hypothetical protein